MTISEGIFFVGKPGTHHLTPGVWVSTEERAALEKLEWFSPVNVRMSDGSWLHMPVDQFQSEYDLAHTDPDRRNVDDYTFIPFTWLVGARVGY